MQPEIKFPTIVDNSMREAFVACPQRFFRSYIQNLTLPKISVHLHAGAAYAKGLEVMRKAFYEGHVSRADALLAGTQALIHAYGDFVPPEDSAKTLMRMVGALEFYEDSYPLDTDYVTPFIDRAGSAALEFTFAIPLPIDNPDTGEPILYGGRFDMMANYRDMLGVYDDKTASQLGANWAIKWRLASQFTGYTWAAREYGFSPQFVMVRGISVLKTQYGKAEIITYRPDWMINRWYEQLLPEIRAMVAYYNAAKDHIRPDMAWPLNQSDSCASYGGCMFLDICDKQQPDTWIDTQFIAREYNPIAIVD